MAENTNAGYGGTLQRHPRRDERKSTAGRVGRQNGCRRRGQRFYRCRARRGRCHSGPPARLAARAELPALPPGAAAAGIYLSQSFTTTVLPAPGDLSHWATDVVDAGAMGFVIMS